MIPRAATTLFCIAIALFIPHAAGAQSADLDVVFEQTPLFSDTNIAPGHTETRTVTVTNNGTDTEDVIVAADNSSSDGLADAVELEIAATSSAQTYFTDSFTEFFVAGEIDLGELSSGASRTYTFSASFDTAAGDAYQDSTMEFDIVVGFQGGSTVTDDSGGGSSSSGSSGGSTSTSTTGDGPFFFPSDFGFGGAVETAGNVLGAVFDEDDSGVEGTTTSTSTTREGADNGQAASVIGAGLGLFRDIGPLAAALLLLLTIFFSWSLFEDYLLPQGWVLRPHFIRDTLLTLAYLAGMVIADLAGALGGLWWLFLGIWTVMAAADYLLHKQELNWNPHPRNVYYASTAALFAVLSIFLPIIALGWAFGAVALVSIGLRFIDRA